MEGLSFQLTRNFFYILRVSHIVTFQKENVPSLNTRLTAYLANEQSWSQQTRQYKLKNAENISNVLHLRRTNEFLCRIA